MLKFKVAGICCAALLVAGCQTTEAVRFEAGVGQNTIMRDGRQALVSRKAQSIVMIGPAGRGINAGTRPVFVLSASNIGKQPIDLAIANIQATQINPSGSHSELMVIPYETLVSEENARQVMGALLVGLAAGANSYNASRAGYGSAQSTVYTPRGTAQVNTTFYSPTAAAIAQSNANMQNEAMISNHIEAGRANLAALEKGILKDNTIMPGQWVGGQLHISPPNGDPGQMKEYRITVRVGPDTHTLTVRQGGPTQ